MNQTTLTPPVDALNLALAQARSFNTFTDQPVTDELLSRLQAAAQQGPTSMNCQPARFVFLRSDEAKDRLIPALAPGNVEKTKKAPITAIVALDSMRPAKSSTQPRKGKTRCALKSKWAPALAF